MRHLSFLSLLLLISACGSGDDRPNVLLIVMDTVRADRCSLKGEPRATTPGLERLAAEGVVFRDAWSPAGWTPPAHASLFTGLRPDHHGVLIGNSLHLDEERVTLAELLRDAGYRTTCLSNNVHIAPEFGMTQGFERVVTPNDRPDAVYPTCRWAHAEALESAIAARDADVPFFIFVNDMEAHLPYTPPEAIQDRFLSGEYELWEQIRAREFDGDAAQDHTVGRKRVPQRMARLLDDLYRAEIACLDEQIEKLVRDLEREGILDDTVIVITSDHGENLGDHDLFGHKASLHKSIRHVPLLIRFPDAFDPGGVVEETVRLEDILPTLLELCGVPGPAGIQGASLLRDLPGRIARAAYGRSGGNLEIPEVPEDLEIDLYRFTLSIRSVYDGRHHLIRYSDGRTELYDVAADPAEAEDLSDRRPDLVERLIPLLSK